MRYLKSKDAVAATGLHPNTLRRYAEQGIIQCKRTPGGQRLYAIEQWLGQQRSVVTVCYARVSSRKQKDDLQRQVEYLQSKYPQAEVIQDIGSGLNFKRKGLNAILGRLLRGEKLRLVVAHRDRLARFGFELVEFLVKQNGGEVLVLHKSAEASPTEELTKDLVAILTVFSARMHGLRSYRDKIKADKNLSDDKPKGSV